MPFEKVQSGTRGGGTEAVISLRKSGSIGINSVAWSEFFDEDHEHAELYYDEDENQIGISALEDDSDASYTINKTDSSASITPTSFLKGSRLIPDVTTHFKPEVQKLNGDTELVVIDLDEPVGTYGSPSDESEDSSEE